MSEGATINEFISSLMKLPAVRQKAAACLLATAVADAAARPLHWVYNREELKNILSKNVRFALIHLHCQELHTKWVNFMFIELLKQRCSQL